MSITYFLPKLIIAPYKGNRVKKTEEWETRFTMWLLLLVCSLFMSLVCVDVLAK